MTNTKLNCGHQSRRTCLQGKNIPEKVLVKLLCKLHKHSQIDYWIRPYHHEQTSKMFKACQMEPDDQIIHNLDIFATKLTCNEFMVPTLIHAHCIDTIFCTLYYM